MQIKLEKHTSPNKNMRREYSLGASDALTGVEGEVVVCFGVGVEVDESTLASGDEESLFCAVALFSWELR